MLFWHAIFSLYLSLFWVMLLYHAIFSSLSLFLYTIVRQYLRSMGFI